MPKFLVDYLNDEDKRILANVKRCAETILEKPVDLAFTDHTIKHKEIVHAHLDSFLGSWLEEQQGKTLPSQLRLEVFVLLCATYLHDIGMQMVHPEILAHLPSLTDDERREAAELPTDEGITARHRAFARRHHDKIAYDWITGSQGDIPGLPSLKCLEGRRKLVALVACGHNIWLTDKESYQRYGELFRPREEPEGTIRVDLLVAFLRLADILDQDKRRVDIEAAKRLPLPAASKVHWWRHHYVNTCRLGVNNGHTFPLKVAFRLPRQHESEKEWLLPALYSATVKEIEAETIRLSFWLLHCGIHVAIPVYETCLAEFEFDPDAEAMPDDVLEAFSRTWPQAEGAASRARLQIAAEQGQLTGNAIVDVYSSLAAAIEIEEYVGNVRNQLLGEFRDHPYSPLELRVDRQPGMRSALDQLEVQLQTRPAKPHPIVLVGDPGGGKTMLLRRYVWEWTEGKRDQGILPVYLQSTRFGDAEWAAKIDSKLGTQEHPCSEQQFASIVVEARERLEVLLAQTLCELAGLSVKHEAAMRGALLDILARASVAVFFDGINELPPTLRNLSTWAIQDFVLRYGFQHRVVVTSRVGDFRPLDFPDYLYCELQPMSEEAVRAYWEGAGVPAKAIRRFFDNPLPGMLELMKTPMAAYMAGELLKLSDGEAITNQGRLFQSYVRETLKQWKTRWPHTPLTIDQAHDLLAEIAFQSLESLQVSFSTSLVIEVSTRWMEQLDDEEKTAIVARFDETPLSAERVFQELMKTGLLYEAGMAGNESLRFRHHTLQDYFAAVAISRRWEKLPTIVAQPVFHEALGMVASVVEDPAGFLERLVHATSDNFGIIAMLPLLFRVVGASTVAPPRQTLTLIFSAAAPLYTAALQILSPYAVEVLSYLFAQTSWQIFAQFLAFIAGNPSWPVSEREVAQNDLVQALNQDGRPTAEALRPFFDQHIPAEILRDHEAAKAVVTNILREGDHANSLERVPQLLAGFTASLSLSVEEKLRIANALARISPNQLGQLQAVFISEICVFGALVRMNPLNCLDTHRLLVDGYANWLLQEEDNGYESGDPMFVSRYLDARTRVGCEAPLAERLVLLSSEIPDQEMPAVVEFLRSTQVPAGMVLADRWNGGNDDSIRQEIANLLRERMESSNDPFLVYWLSALLGESVPATVRQRLEPALISAGAAGYALLAARGDDIPKALQRYKTTVNSSSIVEAAAQIREGNLDALRAVVVEFGLTSSSFSMLLEHIGNDDVQLTAFAQAVDSLDKEAGRDAKLSALVRLVRTGSPDAVDAAIANFGLSLDALFDLCSEHKHDVLIQYLAKRHKVPHRPLLLESTYFSWLHHSGDLASVFSEGLLSLRNGDPHNPKQFQREEIHRLVVRSARALHSGEGHNPRLIELLEAMPASLNSGWPASSWIEMISSTVKNGELPAAAASSALVAVLNDLSSRLSRRERRALMNLLYRIDECAVATCLDTYLSLVPAAGEAAGEHIGNGAWFCYLAGDFERFLSLTEQSLNFCPQADWLLCNLAFAFYLAGKDWNDVFSAYQQALATIATKDRWQQGAVKDLEMHAERFPHAVPIPPAIIAKVAALGNALPAKADDA